MQANVKPPWLPGLREDSDSVPFKILSDAFQPYARSAEEPQANADKWSLKQLLNDKSRRPRSHSCCREKDKQGCYWPEPCSQDPHTEAEGTSASPEQSGTSLLSSTGSSEPIPSPPNTPPPESSTPIPSINNTVIPSSSTGTNMTNVTSSSSSPSQTQPPTSNSIVPGAAPATDSSPSHAGAIAGGVVGTLLLLCIAAVVGLYVYRRRRLYRLAPSAEFMRDNAPLVPGGRISDSTSPPPFVPNPNYVHPFKEKMPV